VNAKEFKKKLFLALAKEEKLIRNVKTKISSKGLYHVSSFLPFVIYTNNIFIYGYITSRVFKSSF